MNVLDIIADQHQAACLGCEGHPQVITPNLDSLAAQGVRFTNAYTQNPICTPSRVSVFSGQYCHNHGYYGLSGPRPQALPNFFSHFKARGYLACITQVDHAVGVLLRHLEAQGLAEETIVIYHADHGGYSGVHGIHEKAPGICSEAVCRVPFLWRVPAVTKPGQVCDALAENVDIAPTITALCGLRAMETTDGKDLTALLRGGNSPVREVAVTENPWSKALRWKQWRFVHYQREMFAGRDVGELYNLADDPDESRNLYLRPEYQDTVHECRRRLLEWLVGTSRVVTAWPDVGDHPPFNSRTYNFRTAGDGKEANTAGPRLRVQLGQTAYI